MLAADQWREPLTVQGLEPAFGTALTLDAPTGDGLGEAFEVKGAEIGQLEQPTYEPAGRLADNNTARRRERLQSCREVWCVADNRLLLSYARADHLADHDQTGRDADPGRERLTGERLQSCQRMDDREPGPDRSLGLVLVRPRPAEVRQHAIAHVLGDETVEARDHLDHALLICREHLPHVFRIEARRKLGGADEIAEHHRELPALGGRCRCRGRAWRRSGRRGGPIGRA